MSILGDNFFKQNVCKVKLFSREKRIKIVSFEEIHFDEPSSTTSRTLFYVHYLRTAMLLPFMSQSIFALKKSFLFLLFPALIKFE